MPGFFERNFTWQGVDSDKDGVIDDVEIWINENIEDPNLRKAYKQFTKDMMIALANTDERETSRATSAQMIDSERCVSYFRDVIFLKSSERIEVQEDFRAQLFNFINSPRNEKRHRMSLHAAGRASQEKKRVADYWQYCRFEIKNRDYYEKIMWEKYPGAFDKPLK